MIELLGPRMVARAAGRFRALGLDEPTLARARREVAMRLDGGKALTREALYGLLERAKIATSGQRGIHILWRLAHDRVLCFGPRAGKQQTFVRFDDWLPHAKTRPREEALAELAARYFTGHGPATVADFAWWSGLTLSEARQAVHLAADRLQRETVHGVAHWLAPAAAPRPAPRARAYLLPAFDEFLVGYTDRSAALEVARAVRVNRGGGILHPTIVVDGRVVGTWKRRLARGEVVFAPDCFEALSAPKARAVSRALERYGEFLGLPARSAP
jgi:hypothetical protein